MLFFTSLLTCVIGLLMVATLAIKLTMLVRTYDTFGTESEDGYCRAHILL